MEKNRKFRISIDYDYIFQQQCTEWLQMHFLETDVSVKLSSNDFHYLSCNERLDLWHLQSQRHGGKHCSNSNGRKPEYFKSLFNSQYNLMVQLANLIKISDKFRIFVL